MSYSYSSSSSLFSKCLALVIKYFNLSELNSFSKIKNELLNYILQINLKKDKIFFKQISVEEILKFSEFNNDIYLPFLKSKDGKALMATLNYSINLTSHLNVQTQTFELLKKIKTDNFEIKDAGLKLISFFHLPNLEILWLNYNNITGEGIKYLSNSNFEHLKVLNLSNNQIRDIGMYYISKYHFKNLAYLNLSDNLITAKGINFFCFPCIINSDNCIHRNIISDISINIKNADSESENCIFKSHSKRVLLLTNLQYFNLSNNFLGDEGIKILSKSRIEFSNLEYLHLNNNKIHLEGLKALSNCRFINLKYLSLRSNNINGFSIKYLFELQCVNLKYLCLSSNGITEMCLSNFYECSFDKLKYMCLNENYFDNRFIKNLKRSNFSLKLNKILNVVDLRNLNSKGHNNNYYSPCICCFSWSPNYVNAYT